MLKKQRIFIGLSVNDWILNIKNLQHELDDILHGYISWQKPESLHLTLVFIGEVDHTTIQRIDDIIFNYITQNPCHRFMLKAEKLFLLNHRHLVLNVVSPELFEVQKTLQDLFAQENIIQPEHHYFNAHITIGKIFKNPEKNIILQAIEKTKNGITQWQKAKISDINIYESHPQKKYVSLSKFHLV